MTAQSKLERALTRMLAHKAQGHGQSAQPQHDADDRQEAAETEESDARK